MITSVWTSTKSCSPEASIIEARVPFQYSIRRLIVRSLIVSKSCDWVMKLSYYFEIWHAHRHLNTNLARSSNATSHPILKHGPGDIYIMPQWPGHHGLLFGGRLVRVKLLHEPDDICCTIERTGVYSKPGGQNFSFRQLHLEILFVFKMAAKFS